MYFLIDNRVVHKKSLVGEEAANAIKTRTLELLGRYIVQSNQHDSWLPPARLLFASSAERAQFLETQPEKDRMLGIERIPSLAKNIDPCFSCHNLDIPTKTWKYLSSGLELFLSDINSSRANMNTANSATAPPLFALCICTTDKALLRSAQEADRCRGYYSTSTSTSTSSNFSASSMSATTHDWPSADHANVSTSSYDNAVAAITPLVARDEAEARKRFVDLLKQISSFVSSTFGQSAKVTVRVFVSMVSRVSGSDQHHQSGYSARNSPSITTSAVAVAAAGAGTGAKYQQEMIERELSELRQYLAQVSDAGNDTDTGGGGTTTCHNTEVQLSAITPSPLLYEELLRELVTLHAPHMHTRLTLPAVDMHECSLSLHVTSPQIHAANTLQQLRLCDAGCGAELGEVCGLVSLNGVPSSLIRGPGLCVEAATLKNFPRRGGGASNAPWKYNNLAFAALCECLRQQNGGILLRVRRRVMQTSASAPVKATDPCYVEYWALVPPSTSALGQNCTDRSMTLLRLLDKESLLNVELQSSASSTYNDSSSNATSGILPPVPLPSNMTRSFRNADGTLRELDGPDTSFYEDNCNFMLRSLQTLGQPKAYDPMQCASSSLDVLLERALIAELPRPPKPVQVSPPAPTLQKQTKQQQRRGQLAGSARFAEQDFYASRRKLSSNTTTSIPAAGTTTNASKKRKAPAREAVSVKSVKAKAKKKEDAPRVVFSSSDSDISLTPTPSDSDTDSSRDPFELPVKSVAARTRSARTRIATTTATSPTATSTTASTSSSKKNHPCGRGGSSSSGRRLMKGRNSEMIDRLSTHAFAPQGVPDGGDTAEVIELDEIVDTDEEEALFD